MPSEPAAQLPHAPGGQTPFQALWRTREYLRPYRWQLVLMLAAAFGAVASEIVIPLLTKAVIDGPIAHAERRLLLPLGIVALAGVALFATRARGARFRGGLIGIHATLAVSGFVILLVYALLA